MKIEYIKTTSNLDFLVEGAIASLDKIRQYY